MTSTGPITFGSMWVNMIRSRETPDDPRRHDVFLVALDQRRAAHGAGELRPERDADGEDQT